MRFLCGCRDENGDESSSKTASQAYRLDGKPFGMVCREPLVVINDNTAVVAKLKNHNPRGSFQPIWAEMIALVKALLREGRPIEILQIRSWANLAHGVGGDQVWKPPCPNHADGY